MFQHGTVYDRKIENKKNCQLLIDQTVGLVNTSTIVFLTIKIQPILSSKLPESTSNVSLQCSCMVKKQLGLQMYPMCYICYEPLQINLQMKCVAIANQNRCCHAQLCSKVSSKFKISVVLYSYRSLQLSSNIIFLFLHQTNVDTWVHCPFASCILSDLWI